MRMCVWHRNNYFSTSQTNEKYVLIKIDMPVAGGASHIIDIPFKKLSVQICNVQAYRVSKWL